MIKMIRIGDILVMEGHGGVSAGSNIALEQRRGDRDISLGSVIVAATDRLRLALVLSDGIEAYLDACEKRRIW